MLLWAYRLPLWIVFSGIFAAFTVWAYFNEYFNSNKYKRLWKIFNILALILSVYIIFESTVLTRTDEVKLLHLEPFRLFRLAKENSEIYRSMFFNVALFLPFGVSCITLLPKRICSCARVFITLAIGVFLSISVEFLQYTLSLGEAEVDDVICNGAGALLGTAVTLFEKALLKIKQWKHFDKRIAMYLIYTFAFSWIFWAFLSYFTIHGMFGFSHPISILFHIVGGFGPFFAGIMLFDQKCTYKSLFRRIFAYKKGTWRYVLVLSLIEILVIALSSRTLNTSIFIFNVPITFIQSVLIYGGNEELGWRGTLQPMLEEKLSFPIASIVTGLVWSVWHLPLWYVNGASQQNMSFVLFTALAIILSFWFSALYKKTKSVFFCSVMHGLTNTLLSLFVIKINWILIIGLTVMLILSTYLSKNVTERN